MLKFVVTSCLFFASASLLHAHPVAKNSYDRTITVRLQRGPQPHELLVRVDYRLEVDETTIVLEDMKPYRDEIDFLDFRNKLEYYAHFTRIYAPVLANHLLAKVDGKQVEFTAVGRSER